MSSPSDINPKPQASSDELNRLVNDHAGQLYHLALRFCTTTEEAEDLVQEVFLQAFRAWESFRHESSEKTWLYTIAARACQRMHRKRSGEPAHIGSLNDLLPFGDPLIAAIPSDQHDALQLQIHIEARQRMESEIVLLPDEFRIPLILKDIVGFPTPEIALILDIPEATVRSRVHRARLKLRSAVDAALPRIPSPAPPPAYPVQTCLDLLDAKQDALDRGITFNSTVICDRCRSVFASLDLTHDICRQIASDSALPDGLRERLRRRLSLPQESQSE